MERWCSLAYQGAIVSQTSREESPCQYCIKMPNIHKEIYNFGKKSFMLSSRTNLHHSGRAFSVFGGKSFTQPQWVLPMSDEYTPKDDASGDLDGHTEVDSLKLWYKVIIRTSNDFDSGISYSGAGVLLAIIGEHGKCCVCRISPFKVGKIGPFSLDKNQIPFGASSQPRFQRGATDIITLFGPDLGKLEAIWVAPEAGTWRIGEVRIRMFPEKAMVDGVNTVENSDSLVFLYDFQGKDILIGDCKNVPAAELKASLPCQVSYGDYLLLDSTITDYAPTKSIEEIREKGMKEYEILKISSLIYTSMLVIVGTTISVASGFTEIAEGFSVGGLFGLFNLFFLQRSVDQLPAPKFSSKSIPETLKLDQKELHSSSASQRNVNEEKKRGLTETEDELKTDHYQVMERISGFRAPLTRFSLIIALVVLVAKLSSNTNIQLISKEVLLAGAAGFLMSKIAVVLASNRPFSINIHK